MYREKLISQIEFLETLQSRCSTMDISEITRLSREILSIAKEIDKLDENEFKPNTDN